MQGLRIDIPLFQKICQTAGAPGHEQRIRELVLREAAPYVDSLTTDNMGNVIAFRKGKRDKKLMFAAHMDEISFIVTHIDEHGFLRFIPLGGFDPKTLTSQRVIVHGSRDIIGVMGSKPIHLMTPEERGKTISIDDFFIDTGYDAAEVCRVVSVGDTITRERDLIEMGDCLTGKSIDNRVAVYILLEMLRELKNTELPFDIYATFTVQEEVGLRGATSAALDINPDFAICIDTTIAYDVPGAKPHENVTKLGEGTAIKIMDNRTICDYRMVRFMKKVAEEQFIKWQSEILPLGGTDTAAMQQYGRSIAGAVSIPTRHIHQTVETAHKADIRATIDLLKACTLNIHQYDWSFR